MMRAALDQLLFTMATFDSGTSYLHLDRLSFQCNGVGTRDVSNCTPIRHNSFLANNLIEFQPQFLFSSEVSIVLNCLA